MSSAIPASVRQKYGVCREVIRMAFGKAVYLLYNSNENADYILKSYHIPTFNKRIVSGLGGKICKHISYYDFFFRNLIKLKELSKQYSNHIVEIIEIINENDELMIILPYIGNFHFLQFNDDKWKKIIDLEDEECAKKLFATLSILHQNNWAHNDIKPNNILVDDNRNLILVDFDHLSSVFDQPMQIGVSFFKSQHYLSNYMDCKAWQEDLYCLALSLYLMMFSVSPWPADLNNENLIIFIIQFDMTKIFTPNTKLEQLVYSLLNYHFNKNELAEFGYIGVFG